MAVNRTVSPSSQGVRANVKKMYDGRGTKTRPIPIVVDTSEKRAIAAAAADSKPKTSAVKMPMNPGIKSAAPVFGDKVSSAPGNVINKRSGTFDPLTGTQNFE